MAVAAQFERVAASFLRDFAVFMIFAPPYYGPPGRQLCVWLHTTIWISQGPSGPAAVLNQSKGRPGPKGVLNNVPESPRVGP
jgi:hypothetical protein